MKNKITYKWGLGEGIGCGFMILAAGISLTLMLLSGRPSNQPTQLLQIVKTIWK